MKVLINGNVPSNTIEAITNVMKGNKPVSIDVEGAGEYEENLEWDSLELTYENDVVEFGEGYTGLWEMMSFDKLRDEAQIELSNDLLGWAIEQISYENAETETLNKAKEAVNCGVGEAKFIAVSKDVVDTLHKFVAYSNKHSYGTTFGVIVSVDGERQHVSIHSTYNNKLMDAILSLHEDSTNQTNIRIVMEHLFFLDSVYVEFEYYKYHSLEERQKDES